MNFKYFIKCITIVLFSTLWFCVAPVFAADATGIVYQAHVQNKGWLTSVTNNEVAGTVGEGLSLEAFQASLPSGTSGIRYCAHVSTYGWQDWCQDGEMAGSIGQSKAVEAIKIELTNEEALNYDIYYRVHSAYLGWLGWASNGAPAGSSGLSLPVQAIQIQVVPKGTAFTESTEGAFRESQGIDQGDVTYNAHLTDIGWQGERSAGQTAGTIGEERGIEAITINSPSISSLENSTINYQTHIQNIGWSGFTSDGSESGTTGQGLNVQAMQVTLSGVAGESYDVYYRAHVQNYGWLDWASNGQTAGTEGLGLRMEAFELVLTSKGAPAPGPTARPSIDRNTLAEGTNITAQGSVEDIGWMDPVGNGQVIGTEGQDLGLEAISIKLPDTSDGSVITYNVNVEDIGWVGDKANGEVVGTEGQNKQMETVAINLAGAAADQYDIYYQAHVEDYGWLGWTKNGEWAGTSGGNRKLEALRIQMVLKNDPAPGDTSNSYMEVEPRQTAPAPSEATGQITADQVPQFDLICAIVQHEGGSSYEGALAVMSCVMNRCDSGRWGGSDPVSILTAPGQFSSYLDGYYIQFLGRSPDSVKQAVLDCINGKRSHPYESFRGYPTAGSVNIGGNWFF